MKLVVLVSGRGSNLSALCHAIEAKRCQAHLRAVVSDQNDAPALRFAADHGIPTRVVPFAKGADRETWNEQLATAVSEFDPDLVVLAGFMRIVGTAFLERYGGRIINVHPSLLPAFPGKDAVEQAIHARVRVAGCTVHVVNEGVDTGPILAQAVVPVHPNDNSSTLHARIQPCEHKLLPQVVDWIASKAILLREPPTPPTIGLEARDSMLTSPALDACACIPHKPTVLSP